MSAADWLTSNAVTESLERIKRENDLEEMIPQEGAGVFGRVIREVRSLVEPGSPVDKEAEWLAQRACELKKRGVI